MNENIVLDDFGTKKVSETEFTGECTVNDSLIQFNVSKTVQGKITTVIVTITNPEDLPEDVTVEEAEDAISDEFMR